MDNEGHINHEKAHEFVKHAYFKPENQKKTTEIFENCIKKSMCGLERTIK